LVLSIYNIGFKHSLKHKRTLESSINNKKTQETPATYYHWFIDDYIFCT